ncbi:uncharacterized protein LTR77_005735 [Saxophila tyrrhenica]|uniref:Citrate transporter-like domain-containing protein n=1 Tax=Saxophila tyrrhenica TaxID=1690608 RepID=A0AAV9PDE4_9PEZI|nr:hypothetical protein LTR77_005735 [Saxophila tyrrhenica]
MSQSLDTSQIREWRSIVTLIVFVVTNVVVLFPFYVPIPVPSVVCHGFKTTLSVLRIRDFEEPKSNATDTASITNSPMHEKPIIWKRFPLNFITAPLIADLFLLAIQAIGREEVHDGTVGADHIYPIDIMVFFITLAYIAISIDASGLIRWLAHKVLLVGGKNGKRLYLYLYTFFFALATFIGNDPIILSGTPFLAYMTKAASNIEKPKAWIFTQFAVANIASAILVSSNPTNLVLAGAFDIKYITYTANMIVPVVVTAIVLFPFLLWAVFRDESLVPGSIEMHTLSDELKSKQPANPNIPSPKHVEDGGKLTRTSTLEEIMNPYLDKISAVFGSIVMAATLVTILALNASSEDGDAIPAYWVTLPAAFVVFSFDMSNGWMCRHATRAVVQGRRQQTENSEGERRAEVDGRENDAVFNGDYDGTRIDQGVGNKQPALEPADKAQPFDPSVLASGDPLMPGPETTMHDSTSSNETNAILKRLTSSTKRRTLFSVAQSTWHWSRATFPTTTTVLSLLPLPLVPFALCIFVLVQALVSKGWIAVFAYGWSHWITSTGTVGAIGGMAFLSVILCNFSGTNIGTTILLCRVVQAWVQIHQLEGAEPISQRTFWAAVYSMAIGVNYGAFSTAFSASLAGMLWRNILDRKGIRVGAREFAWVNLPIIVFTMVVACAVLVGEVYIVRSEKAYQG